VNEALLIAGLHQHELREIAERLAAQLQEEIAERKVAQAALQAAKDRLADHAGELERVVAERTEKLRETVEELEAFSYSVAHDMRAPLRGMQGFARILLDDHAGQLGAEAHNYLERIGSGGLGRSPLRVGWASRTRLSPTWTTIRQRWQTLRTGLAATCGFISKSVTELIEVNGVTVSLRVRTSTLGQSLDKT